MKPKIIFEVRDSDGDVVRRIDGPASKGFHRIAWDLRYPNPYALPLDREKVTGSGYLAMPGKYSVTMYSPPLCSIVSQLSHRCADSAADCKSRCLMVSRAMCGAIDK